MGLAGLKVDSLGHTMATMQFSWPTLSNSGFWSWATSLAYRDFFFFLLREPSQGSICVSILPPSFGLHWFLWIQNTRPGLLWVGWGVGFSLSDGRGSL